MSWWRRTADVARGPDEDERSFVERLALAHLGPDAAERWLSLLRPAVRLVPAGRGEPVVARLGGAPWLPSDVEWPVRDRFGPMTYVAEVDLVALAASGLEIDIRLPARGRILVFHRDDSAEDSDTAPDLPDGVDVVSTRFLHVLADHVECHERRPPEGAARLLEQELAARPTVTWPNAEHPAFHRVFGTEDDPVPDELDEALGMLQGEGPHHQVGGWPVTCQGPVEVDVAEEALGMTFGYGDPEAGAEALRWNLVLQVDSDPEADICWGDVGTLYWLAQRDVLDAGRLDEVAFSWSCG